MNKFKHFKQLQAAINYGTATGSAECQPNFFCNLFQARGNISNLVSNISEQANYRNINLPAGSSQTVFIDVTGQNATKDLQNEIISRIKEKTKDVKDLTIKFFEQEKGK